MQLNTDQLNTTYREIAPLCEKGHVMLVQNELDGQLYVRKHIRSYNPDIYYQLQKEPVNNIPVIHSIYPDDASPNPSGTDLVVIEEYLSGSTLAELLMERGSFSEKDTIDIGLKLCRILMDLHKMKPAVIHRDIKPSNVMLLSDGAVKLLDFNAAKTESADENRDTVLLGTTGFAAPEQYGFSSSTPQTDIYAVGVLLNTMLTGVLPWEKVAEGKLKGIIRRCLKFNPKDRYVSAWDLHRALKRARDEFSGLLPPGFRTMHPLKMLVALPCYLLLVVISLCIDRSPTDDLISYNIMRLAFFLFGFFPILFYCNYLDIQRWYPFMRSPRKDIRIIGFIVAPFLTSIIVLVLAVLLHIIFVP